MSIKKIRDKFIKKLLERKKIRDFFIKKLLERMDYDDMDYEQNESWFGIPPLKEIAMENETNIFKSLYKKVLSLIAREDDSFEKMLNNSKPREFDA